jgi:hypothetical protein
MSGTLASNAAHTTAMLHSDSSHKFAPRWLSYFDDKAEHGVVLPHWNSRAGEHLWCKLRLSAHSALHAANCNALASLLTKDLTDFVTRRCFVLSQKKFCSGNFPHQIFSC